MKSRGVSSFSLVATTSSSILNYISEILSLQFHYMLNSIIFIIFAYTQSNKYKLNSANN